MKLATILFAALLLALPAQAQEFSPTKGGRLQAAQFLSEHYRNVGFDVGGVGNKTLIVNSAERRDSMRLRTRKECDALLADIPRAARDFVTRLGFTEVRFTRNKRTCRLESSTPD